MTSETPEPNQVAELKPCPLPWCDARPEAQPYFATIEGWHTVQCMACGTRSPLRQTKELAASTWNLRPAQASAEAMREALTNARNVIDAMRRGEVQAVDLTGAVETCDAALSLPIPQQIAGGEGDKRRGFMAGLDHIANFINSLDTADMSAKEVRSAIYAECLTARTPHSAPRPLDREKLREAFDRIIAEKRAEPCSFGGQREAEAVAMEACRDTILSLLHPEAGK